MGERRFDGDARCKGLSLTQGVSITPGASAPDFGMTFRSLASAVTALALLVPTAAAAQHTLSLEQALEQLEESSLDLEAARMNITYAERQQAQAYALILPNVQLDVLYQLNDQEITLDFPSPYGPILPFLDTVFDAFGDDPDRGLFDPESLVQGGEPTIVQNRHDVSGSISVTQSLFNYRALPAIRLVHHNVDMAAQGVDQTRYALEGAVLQAYFGAVFAKRMIDVRAGNAELVQLAYDRAVAAFETEVGTRFDVTRAEVELERARREVANAELGYRLAVDGLATLLNVPADFDVEDPSARAVPSDVRDDGAYQLTRPDLVGFALQIERQELLLQESRAQYFPQVFAAFTMAARRETAFGGDPYSWTLQIGLSWQLYDGGVRRAERLARETQLVQIELERERLEAQIEGELRGLAWRIEQERENIASAQLQRDLADESYRLAQEARDLGVATALEVQTAREQLALAELALVTAEVSLQQLVYELAWRRGE